MQQNRHIKRLVGGGRHTQTETSNRLMQFAFSLFQLVSNLFTANVSSLSENSFIQIIVATAVTTSLRCLRYSDARVTAVLAGHYFWHPEYSRQLMNIYKIIKQRRKIEHSVKIIVARDLLSLLLTSASVAVPAVCCYKWDRYLSVV